MKWMLVERKPDVIYASAQATYLAEFEGETQDASKAKIFPTREAAEAHRRTLKQRYNWVSVSVAD